MAALIEYVCTAQHQHREAASVTRERDAWAYCSSGAKDGHAWTRIDPTNVELLRSPAGNARTRLVPDETPQPTGKT